MSSLEKVAPGQRVRSLPAGDWNAFVDAARSHRSGQLGVSADADAPEFSPVIALVKNATGSHLPRYSVLGIAGPVADPQSQSDQFRNQITLVGVAVFPPVRRTSQSVAAECDGLLPPRTTDFQSVVAVCDGRLSPRTTDFQSVA
jgi:hypothetical protein